MNSRSIDWSERAHAAALYLGLLPVYWVKPRLRSTPFLTHHYRQSAIIHGFLLLLLALVIVTTFALSYLLVFHRDLYESLHIERYALGGIRKSFLAWVVFWCFGLGMALLGGMRPMPLIQRLANRPRPVPIAVAGVTVLYGVLLALLPLGVHASSLVPEGRQAGEVYMVYEDNDIFPRWMFALAFYRMALTAESEYGADSPVLLKISREAVAQALAHGRVVFIGSHGTKKGLMLKHDWLLPADLAADPKSEDLSFVYLTGCDSGDQRNAWVSALAPARVVTFDRLTASLEHAWWLWFRGPDTIRAVHAEEQNAQ